MVVSVWAGQTSSGGPVAAARRSVAETEEQRITVAKDGAKRAVASHWRPGPEGAARLSRRQGPLADWNRISIEYP